MFFQPLKEMYTPLILLLLIYASMYFGGQNSERRKEKGAIKLHTQFDVKANVPSFIDITDGLTHDVNFLDKIVYEPGAFYIADKAYIDFERLFVIQQTGAFFVTRAKENMNYRRLYSAKVNKSKGIKYDQTILLNNYYSAKDYPEKIRRIKILRH